MNWQIVNKRLKKYLKKYKSNQKYLQDELEEILNSGEFDDLNKIGNGDKLKRKLLRVEFDKGSYFDYLKQYYLKKTRITNKDVLYMTLILAYWQFNSDISTETMFRDIIDQTREYTVKTLPKEADKKKVKDHFLYIMTLSNHLGWAWGDFKQNEIDYNVREIIREYTQKKTKVDLAEIMAKQQRRHLNINKDKYSGSIESHIQFLVNQTILNVGLDTNMEKAKFLGVKDNRQTKMCGSLNNQIFYLNKVNKYYRYSDEDKAVVEYVDEGLVVGRNLPPITNHYHYCRSSITYQVD